MPLRKVEVCRAAGREREPVAAKLHEAQERQQFDVGDVGSYRCSRGIGTSPTTAKRRSRNWAPVSAEGIRTCRPAPRRRHARYCGFRPFGFELRTADPGEFYKIRLRGRG